MDDDTSDDDGEFTPSTQIPLTPTPPSPIKAAKMARRKASKEAMKELEKNQPDSATPTMRKILDERESVYHQFYPGSMEGDWKKYRGAGWVHLSEIPTFQGQYAKCVITSNYFLAKGGCRDEQGRYICPEEAKKNWANCPRSGYLYKKEDGVEVYGNDEIPFKVCKSSADAAFLKCDITGRLYQSVICNFVSYSNRYKCVNNKRATKEYGLGICGCCGVTTEHDQLKTLGGYDCFLCEVCYHAKQSPGLIGPHNDKNYPPAIYSPKARYGSVIRDGVVCSTGKPTDVKETRLWGVELEVEFDLEVCKKLNFNRFTIAKGLKSVLGTSFILIKEDGTLTMNGKYSDKQSLGPIYGGLEVVSAPADLEAHRARWGDIHRAECFPCLRAWDTESCGMHAHVSRDALTKFQQGRMLMFLNHPNNSWFVWKVAGRSQRKFSKYEEHKIADVWNAERRIINMDEDNHHNRSRRVALNFANKATIEFRIFRGTVNPRHIIRNLEFCDAVIDFCYPASRSMEELGDARYFINYVSHNRKRWPLLAAWMALWGIITAPKPSAKANAELFTLKSDVAEPEDKSNIKEQKEETKPKKTIPVGKPKDSYMAPPDLSVQYIVAPSANFNNSWVNLPAADPWEPSKEQIAAAKQAIAEMKKDIDAKPTKKKKSTNEDSF